MLELCPILTKWQRFEASPDHFGPLSFVSIEYRLCETCKLNNCILTVRDIVIFSYMQFKYLFRYSSFFIFFDPKLLKMVRFCGRTVQLDMLAGVHNQVTNWTDQREDALWQIKKGKGHFCGHEDKMWLFAFLFLIIWLCFRNAWKN